MKSPVSLALLTICAACAVPLSAHAAPYPFSDGFEAGLLNWTPAGTWGTTNVVAATGTLCAADSPGAFYSNNTDAALTVGSGIDLRGSSRPALGFTHRHQLEASYDFGRVEISTDGGNTWSLLPGGEFTGNLGGFLRQQFDLTPYAAAEDFRFRFRLVTDASVTRDGWYIDDVVVAEAPAPVVVNSPVAHSANAVEVTWSASTAPDFVRYAVYRSLSPGTRWTDALLVGEVGNQATTTFLDQTTGPKTGYFYQVVVITDKNLPVPSNEVSVTTPTGMEFPFFDNGEGGSGFWTADAPWALSTESLFSSSHAWSDSPGGNYADGIPSQALTLAFPVDLAASGTTAPALSYRHQYALSSGDSVNVEISVNGGADWSTLQSYTGTSSGGWKRGWHNLTPQAGQHSVLVRFRLTSDAGNSPGDGWHVDDIALSEQPQGMPAPTVVSVNRQAIELSWPAYTLPDFNRYEIYRASTSAVGINDTLVATLTDRNTTTFTDSTVQLDTDYYYRIFVVNGFGTHGPPAASPASARARSLAVTPGYTEDFEDALGPEWAVTGTWSRTNESAHGGSFSLTDSPGLNYPKSSDTSARITLDLTGSTWPVLRYWQRHQFGSGDYGVVEVSSDDGSSWSRLYNVSGDSSAWTPVGLDLSQWKSHAALRIRFRVVSDGGVDTGDGWHIDDVRVENHAGGTAALPLVESFEGGLDDWITDWRTDDTGAYQGTLAAVSTSQYYNTNCYLNYGREVVLPASGQRYLSFWVKDTSGTDYTSGNDLRVDVSTNGGLNWTNLYQTRDTSVAEYWSVRQISLASYAGMTIRLRLNHAADSPTYYGRFLVDLLSIEELLPPPPVTLSNLAQTDRSVAVTWTASTFGPQFKEYRIYRSTSTDMSGAVLVGTIANPAVVSLTDTGLLYGRQYSYRVDVVSVQNLSASSNIRSIVVEPYPAVMPVADGMDDLGNWSVNSGWGVGTTNPQQGTGYAAGVCQSASASEMAVSLDLTGMTWPVMSFHDRHEANSCTFSLQYSTGGTSWSTLTTYAGDQPQWTRKQFDLSEWKNKANLRFRFVVSAATDASAYWHIDDLRVENYAGGTAALPLVESFEGGLGDLITDWRTDDTGAYQGTLAVVSTSQYSNTNCYLNYGREVVLPASGQRYLSFWVKDTSGSDDTYSNSNKLRVDVSTNGGLNWTNIYQTSDTSVAEYWSVRQISLASYAGMTIRLRLNHAADSPTYYGRFLVDLLSIEELLPPPPVTLSNLAQTDRSVAVTWTASTFGPQFKEYRIFRSTSTDMSGAVLVGTIANPAVVSLTDTGLLYGRQYSYRVDVVSVQNLSASSNVRSIIVEPDPVVMPVADGMDDLSNWSVNSGWSVGTTNPQQGTGYAAGICQSASAGEMSFSLDLTGMSWPVMSFYDRHEANSCTFSLQYSTDGTSWSTLTAYAGDQPQWTRKQYDLSQWKNKANLRFRFVVSAATDASAYWHIDDLRVESHAGGTAALPLVESFDGGLDNWITDWRTDDTGAYQGTLAVVSTSESSNPNCYLNYGREVVLPASGQHYLSFWVKDTSGLDYLSSSNYLRVDVSTNGGLNWTNLYQTKDTSVVEYWSVRQISLASYAGMTIRLRLNHAADSPTYYGRFLVDYFSLGEENPAPPDLESPANLTITDQRRPVLTVRNSVDPQGDVITGYRFEVYSNASLTNLVSQVPVVAQGTQTTSWQVDVDLPLEAQYWWRCRATDIKGNVSGWMATASFLVSADNQPPAPPVLVRPAAGGRLDNRDDLLVWQPAIDPNSADSVQVYHLQIDDNADFSSPIVDVFDLTSPIQQSNPGGNPFTTISMVLSSLPNSENLPVGVTLHWRLRARDMFFAWSDWSVPADFLIRQDYGWWRQQMFAPEQIALPEVSGQMAEPMRDGISNLLKFAFNMDPAVVATGAERTLVFGTGTSGLPHITRDPGTGKLRVEYVRRRHAADIRYEVRFCSVLTDASPAGWAAAVADETVIPIDEIWERVVVYDDPPPGASARFARVAISSL